MRTVIKGLPDNLGPGTYNVVFDGLDENAGVIYFRYIGESTLASAFIGPSTAENAWYEEYAEAVHSLGKKWPDELTAEQEAFCEAEADRHAPRPEVER